MFIDFHYTPKAVVICVIIYNAFFGYSWGPIPWLYPPEILPLSIRAKGASLSTATNWAFNWLVGMMTPILQEWIKWRLYLVHAFFCALSFIVVYITYPETKGLQLEDMDELFGDQTTAAPTPTAGSSLIRSSRVDSPVPTLGLRSDGKITRPAHPAASSSSGGISGFFRRIAGNNQEDNSGGQYRRLEEGGDD